MTGHSLRLFSVRGIDIRAHISWLFIVALVSWSFWVRFAILYDRDGGTALVMAIAASVLFFSSVVIHELAHALEAQHRGVHVEGISLFVFGGATHSRFDVKRPGDEFALTAIGPYSSLVLAAVFGLGAFVADGAGLGGAAEVFGSLGWVNLALAIFNMLPGAPLDGGRILRAAVWKATGDRRRSVMVAADAGRVLGGLIVLLGFLQLFFVNALGGLWFVLIGWFLLRAATVERMQAEMEMLVAGRRAGQLVAEVEAIPATASVADAIDHWFVPHESDLFLVRHDGELLGVVDLDTVLRVGRDQRPVTTVGELVHPIGELHHIDADASAVEVVDAILEEGKSVLVLRGSQPVGVVSPARLQRTLQRLHGLERRPAGGRSVRAGSPS